MAAWVAGNPRLFLSKDGIFPSLKDWHCVPRLLTVSAPILFLPLLSSGFVIREVSSSTCEWFEVVLSVTAKHIPP